MGTAVSSAPLRNHRLELPRHVYPEAALIIAMARCDAPENLGKLVSLRIGNLPEDMK
jgi:hypothetical protein